MTDDTLIRILVSTAIILEVVVLYLMYWPRRPR